MKNSIFSFIVMFLIVSCATTAKFPVSSVTPAAQITAKMKKDKNKNYAISVTANYLASVERLQTPMKTYVVWVVTENNGIKNIGQLNSNNPKKSTLQAVTPFHPREIFITAENEGNISYPSGIEISRTKL
ncbi:MAG: hypothetical protein GZ094_08380 [Mariniphaga sp.]|nr:hypothetical protein [Mariniphaga sp.]